MPLKDSQLVTPALVARDQNHVVLQRLAVEDDTMEGSDATTVGDEELLMSSSAHEHTDDDSEASAADATSSVSANGMRRAPHPASATETAPAASKAHKKRKKSAYMARKEEKHRLAQEMEILQEKLTRLNAENESARALLAASERNNVLLRESMRGQQLSLASAHCCVLQQNGEQSNPLSLNHIYLGTDWDDRRRTLLAMKDRTIQHACEYIAAQSLFFDPLKRHVSTERFETPTGDFCCARYDIHQFTNVTSVRQVYDAFMTYIFNIEINVAEHLGDITTPDDFDSVENSIANFRFLSTKFGVPVEQHSVFFMEYFDNHELSQGEPCAVVVSDRVEQDELYPYTPEEKMRRDLSAAVVLRPHWRPRPDGQPGNKLVVSMSMGKFIKLHHPQCPLATPEAMELMRENAMGWGSVMLTTMREILARGA